MILVTGGTGLVGTHLVYELVRTGETVRVLKRTTSSSDTLKGVFQRNNAIQLFDQIKWVEGDVLDCCQLDVAMQGITKVYHCAAIVSFHPKEKQQLFQTNIEGTANVVDACLRNGVKKLCHVSSTSALGKTKDGSLITEETAWEKDKASNYSISKYFAEVEVWRGKEEGLEVVVVNPSIILGAGKWGRSSTNVFSEVWNGLKFYTEGGNAFVDVNDVVKCMMALMNSSIKGERFLIVSENVDFKTFFGWIADALNRPKPTFFASTVVLQIAWRVNWLISKATGKKQVITKETAQSAQSKSYYSNNKIKNRLNIEFIPVKKSIEMVAKTFLNELN